jgi:hypothetical protein
MTTRENDTPIPDWKCERFLLGELDEREMEHIRQLSRQNPELRRRLSDLEHSNQEILRQYPSGVMARQIEEKLAAADARVTGANRRQSWRGSRLVWAPAALAVVLAILLVSDLGTIFERGSGDPSETRLKGSAAHMDLYRRTPTGSERLENRALASEGDLILAEVRSDGRTYGLIVSVDGRGVLTRHYPDQDGQAILMAAGTHALEFAYALDDAPHWEIFLLAFSKDPFATNTLIHAIEGSPLMESPGLSAAEADSIVQSLPLPDGISLSSFTLIKEVGDE